MTNEDLKEALLFGNREEVEALVRQKVETWKPTKPPPRPVEDVDSIEVLGRKKAWLEKFLANCDDVPGAEVDRRRKQLEIIELRLQDEWDRAVGFFTGEE